MHFLVKSQIIFGLKIFRHCIDLWLVLDCVKLDKFVAGKREIIADLLGRIDHFLQSDLIFPITVKGSWRGFIGTFSFEESIINTALRLW